MKQKIAIPYGSERMTFTLDDDLFGGLFSPNEGEPLRDVRATLASELSNPFCVKILKRIRDRASRDPLCRIAIVVNDYTRYTPLHDVLPFLIDLLNECGIADSRICVIAALGTHRPMTEHEFIQMAGKDILDRVAFVNPDLNSPERLVGFGTTESGVEISINKDYVEADFRIALGTIIPHGAVGYSGGAKLIYPGISGRKTIEQFHKAANGNILNYTGNLESPIRQEIERMAERVGIDLLINLVLNAQGAICHLGAGHFIESHRRGCDFSKRIYGVEIPAIADILIASSYHADIDFWQAAKTIFNCQSVVRDGGWLIVVTPCPDGIPNEHSLFDQYIGTPSAELQTMINGNTIADLITAAPAACIARFRERINIGIVSSGLSARQIAGMRFHPFSSVEEAVETVVARIGRRKIFVLTHGGATYPYHAGKNPQAACQPRTDG